MKKLYTRTGIGEKITILGKYTTNVLPEGGQDILNVNIEKGGIHGSVRVYRDDPEILHSVKIRMPRLILPLNSTARIGDSFAYVCRRGTGKIYFDAYADSGLTTGISSVKIYPNSNYFGVVLAPRKSTRLYDYINELAGYVISFRIHVDRKMNIDDVAKFVDLGGFWPPQCYTEQTYLISNSFN